MVICRCGVQHSSVETDRFLAAQNSSNLPEQSTYKVTHILFFDFPRKLFIKCLVKLYTVLEPHIFSRVNTC